MQEVTRVGALVADPRFPAKYGAILVQFFDAYRAALLNAGLEPSRFERLLDGMVDRLAELIDEETRATVRIAAISQASAEAAGSDWADVGVAIAPNDSALLALARGLCDT